MRHKSSDFGLCGLNKVNSNVNVDNMTRMPKTAAENPKKKPHQQQQQYKTKYSRALKIYIKRKQERK